MPLLSLPVFYYAISGNSPLIIMHYHETLASFLVQLPERNISEQLLTFRMMALEANQSKTYQIPHSKIKRLLFPVRRSAERALHHMFLRKVL